MPDRSDTPDLRHYCVYLADGSTEWFPVGDVNEAYDHLKAKGEAGDMLAPFAPVSWTNFIMGLPSIS